MSNFSPLFALLLFITCLAHLAYGQRASTNAQQLCRNKNLGIFPHEEYCDYYYECDGTTGEAIVHSCPNGLAFAGAKRGLIGNCDYPHRVACPDGQRVMGQQPISSENCQWQYGVFPHATSCTRYWHCWNGTSTIQQCPFSLLYNDVIHSCDWPDNVPDCQKHPICKDSPNGAVQIEKSCGRYWLCVGGYPRLQRCPDALAFNPTTLRCELATTVAGCEPPPTTPSSDTSEDSSNGGSGGSEGESGGSSSSSNSATSSPPLRSVRPSPQQASVQPQQGSQPQGALPPPFRPSQPGVRLVGR